MPKKSTQKHLKTLLLPALLVECPVCRLRMRPAYYNHRQVFTLQHQFKLRLQIVRCPNPDCPQFHKPYRPELETRIALPRCKFGLDVLARVAHLFEEKRMRVPRIHNYLVARKGGSPGKISLRSVRNLVALYDRTTQRTLVDHDLVKQHIAAHGFVVLDLYCVYERRNKPLLWVIRDCISGHVFTIRLVGPNWPADLPPILAKVRRELSVPIRGIISNSDDLIRDTVFASNPDLSPTLPPPADYLPSYLRCDFSQSSELDLASQGQLSHFLAQISRIHHAIRTSLATE